MWSTAGCIGRRFQFSARFDAELLCNTPLITTQCQVGHHQPSFAFTENPVEVQVLPLVFAGERFQACGTQFDGHDIELATGRELRHRFHAGAGNMGSAEQGVCHAIPFDFPQRLLVHAEIR